MADEQLNQLERVSKDSLGEEVSRQPSPFRAEGLEHYGITEGLDTDSSSRFDKLERDLQIAQAELSHAHRLITQRDCELAASNQKLMELSGLLQAKEHSLALQRAKISRLLIDIERLGAEREELASFERRILHISPNAHAALSELLAWRQFGQERLGTCFASADRQLEQLWKYAEEMGSPGHRVIRFFSKTIGSTWLGRKGNSLLQFGYVLLKSK